METVSKLAWDGLSALLPDVTPFLGLRPRLVWHRAFGA
jgi:hypothetical protein